MARNRVRMTLKTTAAALAVGAGMMAVPGVASADATDDYPIPNRILKTPCTAQQIMLAARDVEPVYFKPADVQQGARDRINWFFSLDYAGRRQYSENMATNAFYESMSWKWPNWAKVFFNNKGVAANTTDVCQNYPDDPNIWNW